MRLQQFQVSVVEQTKQKLPRALRAFNARSFFTLVKLAYTRPKIHYEIAVRGKERLIEVGLHCEADPATNAALLDYFQTRAFEIVAELGPRIEIEQWTSSWSRVHQVIPYTTLDVSLVARVADELARLIVVLEPMIEQFFKPAARKRGGKKTNRVASTETRKHVDRA